MAAIISNGKILFLEFFFIVLVSSAPHGLNDQSGISTTTSALKTALTTVFALGTIVSLAIVFFGCICCQQQRFKSASLPSNGIPLPQHSNNAERVMESEFAIFPPPHAVLKQPVNLNHDDAVTFEPLPDIRLRKFSSPVSGYFPKPAYFSSDVNKGLSLHDWFDDPQSNFPRSQLQYFSEVGSGWFGQVVEGEAQHIIPEEKKTQVVVKILREDASPSEHIYFLHEVRSFRELKHPNVLRLFGRCLEVDPFLVILEHSLMDLKSYLIQHRSNPESLLQGGQLLRAACHVAKGLNHMHENNVLHTDLAARNCLVSHDHVIKIGDYGISVNAFKEDYYCVGDIALPIRWCSPESLVYSDNAIRTKDLTQEANIWSFGVLLWEMIELGKLPYMEFSDEEVLQKAIVQQILTLEQPKTPCLHKDQLWQVMKLCWNLPQDRPSVHKVSLLLDHLFENKDVASDSVAFETRWNALQPVVREHNLNPISHDLALTFESDFVPNQFLKGEKNHDNFLSSDFDVSSLRETSSSRCSLTQSFEANFGKTISPSLQNLRGSFEDLALHNSLDRELEWDPLNVTNSPANYKNKLNNSNDQIDDKVINDQICEAIKDLDEFLAGEVTSSEVSKDTTPERNESGDEDMEFKNELMRVSLEKSEPKNGSATTLTDVNTETGETLPKDSSDDSLHAHLISDLGKLDGSSKTDLPDLISSNILKDDSLNNSEKEEKTNLEANEIENKLVNNLNQMEALDSTIDNKISNISLKISPKIKFPEKEPHRDSAIVLESESSSSTLSSKIDDGCLPQAPENNFPIMSNLSSQTNLVTNDQSVKGESSKEEYVSTIASPQAFVSSFTSDSSTLLSILNEPLTCGNPGSTTSMAVGGNGGNLFSDSASKTNTLDPDQPSLLTKPMKSTPFEDSVLTKNGCDFRCTLNNDDIKPNLETSSANYHSLSVDATNSQSDNIRDNTSNDVNSFNVCEEAFQEDNGNTFNSDINSDDENDIIQGCTDEMEVNFFSDSDLESLGEGYDGSSSRTHKSSTPRKDGSKPSKSLSESSLGATYYTACDHSNLDESLKLEEESVLPFIEVTLCEDTDTLYNTCHSDTPTINDEQNSESDMTDESFEQQLGYLSQENDVDQNFVEAINSELIYGFSESTPSENSPSMLSVPSSENMKLDKDSFSDTLFMQTDEGNCRPNYKTQLASFAFEKELNGIVLNRELNSISCEKPQVASQYSNINNDSVILSNVEKVHHDLTCDSFSLSGNTAHCQDHSYLNGEFEQSNPEISSNSFVYINSKHSSWFHPPPLYEDKSVNNSSYYDEESIVEDISEGGAQASRYLEPNKSCQEYQLEDILACLYDTEAGNDNPAYSEEEIETNPSIFSPIEDSGKYSSMADDDDNSIILDDVNQGAHCSDDMKDYLDDEVLIIDTETNEAVMLDSKERLSLAMGEENMSYYDRQLYVNEVYDPENYYGPTKLESIVEEFEGASNATSPSYSGDSNLSNVSPDKGFINDGMRANINEYGFNSQEDLDKSISDPCSCVEEECSTNFGAKSSDCIENSPQLKLRPPVLIFEGEEYLAGAETDDGFDDYDNEDYESQDTQRPGTSMLAFKEYQENNSQTASETDEDDFILPKEKREDVLYTPDFESDTDDTSSTGTSESSTSGSFECSNDGLDEKDENRVSPVPEESKTDLDITPASPVKIFSTAWDSTLTPTKSAIKSPEKKVGDMKKSVSFHEEGPAYIFSYPPESDSEDDDEGNEVATEFTWHVDYTNYADWEFQPIDAEEIPEDIVEMDDIEVPQPEPLTPVNLSTMMYSIIGISEDDLLDSLDSQTRADNGIADSFVLNEIDFKKSLTTDDGRGQLRFAIEEETSVKFEEEEDPWPIDDFPEIVTGADGNESVDDILETINPFIIDLSMDLPCMDENVDVNRVLEKGNECRRKNISESSDDISNIELNPSWSDDNVVEKSLDEVPDNSYGAMHEKAPDLILTFKSGTDIKEQYDSKAMEDPTHISLTDFDVVEVSFSGSSIDLNPSKLSDNKPYHAKAKFANNGAIKLSAESGNFAEFPLSEITTDRFLGLEVLEKPNDLETRQDKQNYEDQGNGNILPDICNIEKQFACSPTEMIAETFTQEKFLEHGEFENETEILISPHQITDPLNFSDTNFYPEAAIESHKMNTNEDIKVDQSPKSVNIDNISPKSDVTEDEYIQAQTETQDSIKQVTTTTTQSLPIPVAQSNSLDNEHTLSTSDVISESEDEESLKEKLLNLSSRTANFNELDESFERDEIHEKFHDNMPGKYFGIGPNKKYYKEMQLNYNLNDHKEPAQDIPLEIDEILFEMERSFSLTDIAIASSEEPIALPNEYKITRNDDKKRNLLKFKEDSLSFEGESSESKSSSSLPKLNDISPALSSDIDICESDLEDMKEDHKKSDKYVIKVDEFNNTDDVLDSTVVNGNFINNEKEIFNYENNNEERLRLMNEVVSKTSVTKMKMDNTTNQDNISS